MPPVKRVSHSYEKLPERKVDDFLYRDSDHGQRLLTFHDLVLDMDTGCILYGGSKIKLTKTTADILALLMSAQGRVYHTERLYGYLYTSRQEDGLSDSYARVYINRIRETLRNAQINVRVMTVRLTGYYLEPITAPTIVPAQRVTETCLLIHTMNKSTD